ncbi:MULTISPECIES: ABC transporter ATP-binding protein [unclassified Colwellia]|jgi:ABC-2 type transport system ATP-binding protein|uniref:ABC transporter ATP-binding protein n=1 Tax=unclassified Colwellia TaxID=196834 RepID=UPI0015F75960|nr:MULTISPECIES: ABC transporter ATP-binding protein [unclassified Colwellia]MBA6233675.1 ABC transporter ATP-binding protein [Colwellia sp. MB02u-7]MBA6237264.1 ABC transporter ATP-binding protein [Colwellia sp. MB02u-11]MBA6257259.1 ABC transporter ATP-binding protein [Colwellia sp. MB3u-28]MBA6258844.1 ABC transporter ATP-binding protein [Colwellia sp. MB3u-41]MBA6300508.1 ABC transporter ATP-binding protein [Colwellia sp. MB3u-22]
MSLLNSQTGPLIQVNNLSKSFGDHLALDNVSFNIEKGQPIALVGPNGAGKTTLFSLLCGYLLPSSGSITIAGFKTGDANLFGRLAALPQDAQFDPRFSIAEQLTFYAQLQGFSRKKAIKEAQRTLELVGLADTFNAKPDELSHGMRKRVAIAQALIGSPDIVMLDEATAGLDPINAREVRELVASLSSEITFILSSHDLSELERLCSQVLYLEKGQLQQHQNLQSEEEQRYLTIRMRQSYDDFLSLVGSIANVQHIEQTQSNEFLITSSAISLESEPLDLQILQLCHKQQWQYSQLTNGKTLENRLF